MAKHGIHIGRKTEDGMVLSYAKGRYTIRCNCGAFLYGWDARQAAYRALCCPGCWIERQSVIGKRAKGWPLRKGATKPPVNVGKV